MWRRFSNGRDLPWYCKCSKKAGANKHRDLPWFGDGPGQHGLPAGLKLRFFVWFYQVGG
jgi:hypothetical protein